MLRPYVFPCRFSGRMTDLKRSLRLTDGLAMVVGMTVGAGIFRTPGIVAARLGRPGLTFVVWVLGAGLAFLGALCFAELTTRQPRAAGKYAFVREAFGTRAGFVVGWVEALGTNGVAIAAIGVAAGEFLVRLLGWPPALIAPLGAGLVALFTGINLVGVASGRWVQNVVTAAKLLALGGVVVIAFARGTGAGWHGALPGAPVGLGVGSRSHWRHIRSSGPITATPIWRRSRERWWTRAARCPASCWAGSPPPRFSISRSTPRSSRCCHSSGSRRRTSWPRTSWTRSSERGVARSWPGWPCWWCSRP